MDWKERQEGGMEDSKDGRVEDWKDGAYVLIVRMQVAFGRVRRKSRVITTEITKQIWILL